MQTTQHNTTLIDSCKRKLLVADIFVVKAFLFCILFVCALDSKYGYLGTKYSILGTKYASNCFCCK